MKNKKSLYDRIHTIHCKNMMVNEMQTMFTLKEQIEFQKQEMYKNIIKELKKQGYIEEEIEDTPDYKLIKMKLIVVEPEEPDEY